MYTEEELHNVGGGDTGCFSVFSREWEGQEKDGNTEFVVQTFQKRRRFRTPALLLPLRTSDLAQEGRHTLRTPIAGEL